MYAEGDGDGEGGGEGEGGGGEGDGEGRGSSMFATVAIAGNALARYGCALPRKPSGTL